jgi:hypothetical protein
MPAFRPTRRAPQGDGNPDAAKMGAGSPPIRDGNEYFSFFVIRCPDAPVTASEQ